MEDSKSEPGTSEDQTLKSIYKVCIMTISSFINLFIIVILIYFFVYSFAISSFGVHCIKPLMVLPIH